MSLLNSDANRQAVMSESMAKVESKVLRWVGFAGDGRTASNPALAFPRYPPNMEGSGHLLPA